MTSLHELIKTGETLVCDGATGTMLFAMGLEPGGCPDAVALEQPQLLEELAKSYADAGSQIVEACTFGASPLKLAQYDLEGKTEEINRTAVAAVRNAVGDRTYIAASIGPSGRILEPYGDVSPDELYESYLRQTNSLNHAGIDCFIVETMLDINEATLAIKAAKEAAPAVPVAATMTFDSTPRGFFTIMGVDIPNAVSGLVSAGAESIGSNCGNGMEKMVEIARAFREQTDHPLIIQSNAGLPETEGGKVVYNETPEFMTDGVKELLGIGVSMVGGCCGTTPEHIQAFRGAVDDSRT